MNETKRLFDDEDQENFYLLSDLWKKTVTMETTVINSQWQPLIGQRVLCGWKFSFCNINEGYWCVKFAVYFVVFTRVKSVKGSPTVEGDNGYLKVGSVPFNVKLALCALNFVLWRQYSRCCNDVDIGLNERCLKLFLRLWRSVETFEIQAVHEMNLRCLPNLWRVVFSLVNNEHLPNLSLTIKEVVSLKIQLNRINLF